MVADRCRSGLFEALPSGYTVLADYTHAFFTELTAKAWILDPRSLASVYQTAEFPGFAWDQGMTRVSDDKVAVPADYLVSTASTTEKPGFVLILGE